MNLAGTVRMRILGEYIIMLMSAIRVPRKDLMRNYVQQTGASLADYDHNFLYHNCYLVYTSIKFCMAKVSTCLNPWFTHVS